MGRAPCCEKNGLKKGPWTLEEDEKLIDYIQKNGYGNWRILPKNAGLQRCGKSCRLRWTNYLRPDIKRGRFSFEEEETIIQLHSILGNKWSLIAARLPGRTDNEIKNYWNSSIRKRLLGMGIDPVTHTPRLEFLDLSRLLLMQPLINPEFLKIATSLLSSHRHNQDFLIQNTNNYPQIQNQIPPSSMQTPVQDITASFSTHDQSQYQLMQYNDVKGFSQNLAGFGFDWQQRDHGQSSTLKEDYIPVPNYGYCESGQCYMHPTPSSETSTFQSNSSKNFSFQSVLSNKSTPDCSSSQTPLHSTEDEMESYCSSMLKFEIQDILDVNDFM